jgi:hypothetical protein
MVSRIHGADNHDIGPRLLDYAPETVGAKSRHQVIASLLFQAKAMVIGARQPGIAQSDEFGDMRIIAPQWIEEHGNASQGAHGGMAF